MKNERDVMKCTQVRELLCDLLEGHIEGERTLLVEDHLASCDACRREKNHFVKSWEMLDEWPDIQPDPLYRAQFWEKAGKIERNSLWSFLREVMKIRSTASGALISMILLLGGLFFWNSTNSRPWESQAYQPWNRNMMEHVLASVEGIEDSPRTAGAFFNDPVLITLPDYVNENEGEIYPELDIGRTSFAMMDGAYEMMGSMAGGGE